MLLPLQRHPPDARRSRAGIGVFSRGLFQVFVECRERVIAVRQTFGAGAAQVLLPKPLATSIQILSCTLLIGYATARTVLSALELRHSLVQVFDKRLKIRHVLTRALRPVVANSAQLERDRRTWHANVGRSIGGIDRTPF